MKTKSLYFIVICFIISLPLSWLTTLDSADAQLFSSPVSYPSPGNPHHVYAKDFDGDGDNDLVVCGYEADIISILFNNGDGTFGAAVSYPAGGQPSTAIAEDLNGDGDFDLAIPNDYTNYISILVNDGNGAFNTRYTYTVGNYPYYLSVADFDKDGSKDIAVANAESDFTSILLNKGDGTFYPSISYQTGANVMSTFAGDFDGDGDNDLATSNMGSQTVSILLNNGDGTFVKNHDYSIGADYFRVYGGNFDGDGDIDLAVTNGQQDKIYVLLNDGTANFTVAHQYPTDDRPFFLYSGDLNGDCYDDIATANMSTNTISVFLNNGDGSFQGPDDYVSCNQPHSVYAEDLDGDGDKDLLIADYFGNAVQIFFNQSDQQCVPSQMICDAFLTAQKVNVGVNANTGLNTNSNAAAKMLPGKGGVNVKHDFKLHLLPCEPMDVSIGDSAEVFVDTDKDGSFEVDEEYPAVVSSTDSNGYASDIAIKVFIGEDLINNDPCVAINSVNDVLIVDTLEHKIDYLCLNTFTPPQGQPSKAIQIVNQFELPQNYPNPFNPETEISYSLPNDSYVKLAIYNIKGQKVKTLVNGFETAGYKAIRWDGTDETGQKVASGIYFYRLEAGDFTQTRKMVLMK